MSHEPIGTFVKGDRTKVAYTKSEAVGLRFDGWTPETAKSADPTPPPQSGRGSSRDAWAAYAGDHGVEVTDDMDRDAIVAATQAMGVPTT